MATMQSSRRGEPEEIATIRVRPGQIDRMIQVAPQPSKKLQAAIDRRRRMKSA